MKFSNSVSNSENEYRRFNVIYSLRDKKNIRNCT
jgi:hypothetical protein